MTNPQNDPSDARDELPARAVLVIVLAGTLLGVGYNLLLRDVDPARALPWVKGQRTVARLELESHTPPAAAATVPSPAVAATAPAAPSAAPGTTAPVFDPPSPRLHEPAPGRSSGTAPSAIVSRAPKLSPSAASGAPVGTDAHPPISPPVRMPAGTAPASDPTPAQADAGVPVIPESREPMEASLDVVRRLYEAGAAVILDARPAEEYAAGHIAGALSLPFDDVFKHPERVRAVEAKGRPVVAYCDGGDCELSRDLAFALIDAGQRKVLVFGGGLPAWRSAGLAVRTGPQP